MRSTPSLAAALSCALLPALAMASDREAENLQGRPLELECTELSCWDAQHGDRLGYSVASSAKWLLAGAPYDDLTGRDSGSVAVYRLGAGPPEQVDLLAPSDGHRGTYFGMSVAVDGDRCAIGAPWDDDRGARSGSVYVFRWDGETWRQEAKLLASDGETEDRFGCSVAIAGESVAVGARWDDDLGENSGAVHLFRWNGQRWAREAKVDAGEIGGALDEFGVAVALSGDRLAVGAYADPLQGIQSGAAYVFRREAERWSLEGRLEADDGAEGDGFGVCVALEGHTCVVGAPWKQRSGEETGAVYVFDGSAGSWLLRDHLTPDPAPRGGSFGRSVAISGPRILVGAPLGGSDPERSGAAFLYRRFGERWSLVGELPRPRAEAGDGFGGAVTLQGLRITVGAQGLDATGTGADHGHLLSYAARRGR